MASVALIAELDAYAPEFSQRADRGEFLDRAARRVSAERYGTVYTDAVVLIAAHMLELDERRRMGMVGGGAISSQASTGTVNYHKPDVGSGAYYMATQHGLSFLELRRIARSGPVLLDDDQATTSRPN